MGHLGVALPYLFNRTVFLTKRFSLILCSLYLGFFLEPVFAYPSEGGIVQKRNFEPTLEILLKYPEYELGRIGNARDDGCRFVEWKTHHVVSFIRNPGRDTAILMQTSAGIISCVVKEDTMQGFESGIFEPFDRIFLGNSGFLILAKSAALDFLNGVTPENSGQAQYLVKVSFFAIQVWTGTTKKPNPEGVYPKHALKFPKTVQSIYSALRSDLGVEPAVYTYPQTARPQGNGVAPAWTCAVSQEFVKGAIPYVTTTVKVYLGKTGAQELDQGQYQEGYRKKYTYNPVLTLTLTNGYVVPDPDEVRIKNGYLRLAFQQATISYDPRYPPLQMNRLMGD